VIWVGKHSIPVSQVKSEPPEAESEAHGEFTGRLLIDGAALIDGLFEKSLTGSEKGVRRAGRGVSSPFDGSLRVSRFRLS